MMEKKSTQRRRYTEVIHITDPYRFKLTLMILNLKMSFIPHLREKLPKKLMLSKNKRPRTMTTAIPASMKTSSKLPQSLLLTKLDRPRKLNHKHLKKLKYSS